MKLNLAFYTYFYGSNNNQAYRIPNLPSTKYDCYYYTNNLSMIDRLKGTKWIAIFDNKPTNDDIIESCLVGKHVKTCPHEYNEIKDYSYLCYLDSKLQHVSEKFVEDVITKYFIEHDYALILREHWFIRNSVWNEFNLSISGPRYKIEKEKYKNYIYKQISKGLNEHHAACGFLIRNMKHDKIIELNTTWYQHIQECGIQDQISFFFVKQLFEGFIYYLTDPPFV